LNEEDEESDRTGVFNILGIFDNFLGFLPPLANQIVEQTELLPWLLSRLTVPAYDSNKQYASEVLAVLLQEERGVRMKLADLGGIEPLLLAVSVSAGCSVLNLDGVDPQADLSFLVSRPSCRSTAIKTLATRKNSNTWKTSSTPSVPFSPSPNSSTPFSKQKVSS
jgi:hypothetical protein